MELYSLNAIIEIGEEAVIFFIFTISATTKLSVSASSHVRVYTMPMLKMATMWLSGSAIIQ